MDNKFLLFIIGLMCMGFLCWSTGAGFGSALLDDGDTIRILSHDVIADNGGVAIYGDKNSVEYTNNPEPPQTTTTPTVEQRNRVANVVLGIVGLFIGFIFLLAAISKRRTEQFYLESNYVEKYY